MLKPITGLLLILVPIAFNATFFLLQKAFSYPDILRQPTETILRRVKESGAAPGILPDVPGKNFCRRRLTPLTTCRW